MKLRSIVLAGREIGNNLKLLRKGKKMEVFFMKTKKVLALFLCVLLCMGTLTVTSFAATTEITADSTEDAVYAAFGLTTAEDQAKLAVDPSTKTLSLQDDIEVRDTVRITGGEWTLLGEGHTLTFTSQCFVVGGDAVLKLGQDGEGGNGITITSEDNNIPVFYLNDTSKLYMYENVTIGPSSSLSTPAGIDIGTDAAFYMHGGKITGCVNGASTAGGVYINDNGQFHMYGGVIENCSGCEGGAVGIADGTTEIGPNTGSNGLFHMYGGTIKNCTDNYKGGGAVSIALFRGYTNYGQFIMDGGTITDCKTAGTSTKGGGAICINAADAEAKINGGTITKNSTSKAGGGIYVGQGTAAIAAEAAVYDNHADTEADDIAVGSSRATVTIAKPPSGLTLSSGREIDGWYKDSTGTRWDLTANYPPIPVSMDADGTRTFNSKTSLKAAHAVRSGLEVSPPTLDFGSAETGYTVPAAQTVTVTNIGDKSVTSLKVNSEHFEIGPLSQTELAPGATATFTVSPKASLPAGAYSETITVSGTSNYKRVTSSVTASFTVKEKLYTLTVELNGGNGATTGGSYAAGTVVPIDAGKRAGYTFNGWTSSNGGDFANKNAASTSFTMPGADTTVTAAWARNKNHHNTTLPPTPETGDSSNMPLWIALLSLSGAGVLGAARYSRKRKA